MDVTAHFRSLTRELEALKDRVRNFSEEPNWQTDGEWKESVLRATLRRYLPRNIEPLRGFVVTECRTSRQIDLLLYDAAKPVLFRDGDLVFVSPDAVVGIVEVKTRIASISGLRAAIEPLADTARLLHENTPEDRSLFVGLFAYETGLDDEKADKIINTVSSVAAHERKAVVDHLSLGCSLFLKFWDDDPGSASGSTSSIAANAESLAYNLWHCYLLADLAAGYFLGNLVESVVPESVRSNSSLWFPEQGKESRLLARGAL